MDVEGCVLLTWLPTMCVALHVVVRSRIPLHLGSCLTQSQLRGYGWQQDRLGCSPRAPSPLSWKQVVLARKESHFERHQEDPVPEASGLAFQESSGTDFGWDGIISEQPVGAGSSLLNRQAAVGSLHVATHKTQVEHVK